MKIQTPTRNLHKKMQNNAFSCVDFVFWDAGTIEEYLYMFEIICCDKGSAKEGVGLEGITTELEWGYRAWSGKKFV